MATAVVYLPVPFVPRAVNRRTFIQSAVAALAWPAISGAQSAAPRRTLYNGIVLAEPWPPRRAQLSAAPERPPYLASPPAVINIDTGRQLFVDDFLIQESSLYREFHQARYHPGNPVLRPERPFERHDPYAAMTGTAPSASAMPFSDGVFYDPADRLFKMWYMAGYQQHTALAVSRDGLSWERPSLDVVPGTNIVSTQARDSNTVWLDLDAANPGERFKMAGYDLAEKALRLHLSADGIHWRAAGRSGPCGDRSTFFRNPFLETWVFSLRADEPGSQHRYRRYLEAQSFAKARWDDAVPWVRADSLDLRRADLKTAPQIYHLDAVAYESVMLGLFTMFRGEQSNREKPNDLCVGFSRDGFHWSRTSRDPFIPVSERSGDWNWSNVQSAGGCCLVVGDQLYFYVSGRQGVPGTDLPGECATGLAILRRDGFASVSDRWPAGVPKPVTGRAASLTTRPIRFSGRHLFVNAAVDGTLQVEVLDESGGVIEPYSAARAIPVSGDGTRLPVQWRGRQSLEELAGTTVRFRFTLERAKLFAFWVSADAAGASRGYLAAGGPGLSALPLDAIDGRRQAMPGHDENQQA